jgi:hypothetical protein
MVIACERYLDDGTQHRLTLELATRTLSMHAVLAAQPSEVHRRLQEVLVAALDEVAAVLGPVVREHGGAPETSSFGCGT